MKTPNLSSGRLVMTAVAVTSLLLSSPAAFAADTEVKALPSPTPVAAAKPTPTPQQAEQQSKESQAVNPQVQSEVEKRAADKRAQLLKDAESARRPDQCEFPRRW